MTMPPMPTRVIGQLVPSSNRTVERTTEYLLRRMPELGACYARIPYRPDGSGQPEGGYDVAACRVAADLLQDAGIGALSWNGTKGALDGFQVDRDLAAELAPIAGCPVRSVALDVLEILRRLGAKRIGLITQGQPDRTAFIGERFAAQGFPAAAQRSLGLASNLEAAEVSPATLSDAVRGCARDAQVEAVLIWGTNMPGLPVVAKLEAELGIAVVDSCSIGLWGCLDALGISGAPWVDEGKIFGLLKG
ncbi:maleate cis-trans isomerase family protein [Siccirubricoccus phaeus]|uniref:maleate cis-trans isomerase family protein n=1 Tax=Siccirubricoccus phaeus TaxID=2595053 RepID=UPI0011F0B314|nr:aspartate/glutamate racemase family protein [Siccirubricoccus phaeus]